MKLASRGESNGGGGGGFVVLVVERTIEAFTRHHTVVPLSKPFLRFEVDPFQNAFTTADAGGLSYLGVVGGVGVVVGGGW